MHCQEVQHNEQQGRHLGSGLAVERLLQAPHEVRQPLARALVQLRLARHLVAARAPAATPQLCPWYRSHARVCFSGVM